MECGRLFDTVRHRLDRISRSGAAQADRADRGFVRAAGRESPGIAQDGREAPYGCPDLIPAAEPTQESKMNRTAFTASLLLAFAPTASLAAKAPVYVVGDSIALGLSQALHARGSAKTGIPSKAVIGRVPQSYTGVVVISAGSNDPANPALQANLEASRARAPHAKWVWVVPRNPKAAAAVRSVAAKHHDLTVGFQAGNDRVHPRSYGQLATSVRVRLPSS